jgi:hypothetical protein
MWLSGRGSPSKHGAICSIPTAGGKKKFMEILCKNYDLGRLTVFMWNESAPFHPRKKHSVNEPPEQNDSEGKINKWPNIKYLKKQKQQRNV